MRSTADIKENLDRAKKRFLDVMKMGDAAISTHDLAMGYDADFYLNRVPLLRSHIIQYRKELERALRHGEQTTLF